MKTYARASLSSVFLAMLAVMSLSYRAAAAEWTNWERENAVTQNGDWLVIRQPGEGYCYAKQSYGDSSRVEVLAKRDGFPVLTLPFFRGVEGEIEYWVDGGTRQSVPVAGPGVKLPKSFANEMRQGQRLFIRVTPVGERTQTQTISLRGFTAATRRLEQPDCDETFTVDANGARGNTRLNATLGRDRGGKVLVLGTTSLPDGMILMIGLRRASDGYFAQSKVKVLDGRFTSEGFSNRGSELAGGTYVVDVSSPLPSLQPASVRSVIGESGERLSGPAVNDDRETNARSIRWKAKIQLE